MKPALKPDWTLLVKLGSIIVHQQELASLNAHFSDKIALDALLADPEVVEWFEAMNRAAFLPVKR